ncbi:MAG: GNAT family N-acetyltransferase [Chloroflexi bacterium]|nr:GNAT family N-acetyltransferase [Chloroflexota bacterium]
MATMQFVHYMHSHWGNCHMYRIAQIQSGQGQALRTIRMQSVHHANLASAISQTQLLALSPDQWEQKCAESRAGQNNAIFLAWHQQTVVGMVGVRIDPSPKMRHAALVWGMFVAPHHRGKRLGTQLLERVIDHARLLSLLVIKLSATTNQPEAIQLYCKLGFERYAYEPALMYVDGIAIDALHMHYRLERK